MKIENLIVLENQLYNTSNNLKEFQIYISNKPNVAFIGVNLKTNEIYVQYKNDDNTLTVVDEDIAKSIYAKNDYIVSLEGNNHDENYFIEKVDLQDLVLEYNELLDFRNGINPKKC